MFITKQATAIKVIVSKGPSKKKIIAMEFLYSLILHSNECHRPQKKDPGSAKPSAETSDLNSNYLAFTWLGGQLIKQWPTASAAAVLSQF